jgi:phage repressor protein C with HTH and peptisase S24 domain
MATRPRVNKESSSDDRPRSRPATTPEAREQQLIASAIGLAEKQIRDGSASAQVITHYLKLGSSREQLEQERLRNENQLTQAKIEAMASAQRVEELYKAALGAMKSYSSGEPLHMEIDVDEE